MRYELTLHYRGELKSNGDPRHKHDLRKHFHRQLKEYINDDSRKSLIDAVITQLELRRGTFRFVPIISDAIYMAAEIEIFMLRPGPRGSIVTRGGDIDNRLKTLLDSLKVPEDNALPRGSSPCSGENPFYCLLKDDSLVTSLKVSTDELLEPGVGKTIVDLTIRIVGEEIASFMISTRDENVF